MQGHWWKRTGTIEQRTTRTREGQLMTQHWTVVADGQETGVYTDNYSTAVALAEEYLTYGAEDIQIVEVNQ